MKNAKKLTRREMTEEQINETNLAARCFRSEEKRILEEYAGKPIEEVPEEYREKIAKLRSYGLGKEEKTTYEDDTSLYSFLRLLNILVKTLLTFVVLML